MQNKNNLRHSITAYVILIYFLPILFFLWYSRISGWIALPIGLLIGVIGSIFLILKMYQWESVILEKLDRLVEEKSHLLQHRMASIPTKSTSEEQEEPPIKEPTTIEDDLLVQMENEKQILHNTIKDLQTEKEQLNRLLQQTIHEKESQQYKSEQMLQEVAFYQQTARDQMKQKDMAIAEYAQTIADLRASMEKKQQHVAKLESSVADLTYEVRTLLHLSDPEAQKKIPRPPVHESSIPPPPYSMEKIDHHSNEYATLANAQLHTSQEASVQLKRCIDIAQKLTGATHFGTTSRFRDMPIDNSFALDQRRLFESLRSEISSMILVYSQKEDKLVFVNNQSKTMLGWSPERFIQDFPQIMLNGMTEWKRGLIALAGKPEVSIQLNMKTRTGQDQQVDCLLGTIPTGLFKGHVIGVLYSKV